VERYSNNQAINRKRLLLGGKKNLSASGGAVGCVGVESSELGLRLTDLTKRAGDRDEGVPPGTQAS